MPGESLGSVGSLPPARRGVRMSPRTGSVASPCGGWRGPAPRGGNEGGAVPARDGTGREPEPPLRSSSRRRRTVAPRCPPAPRWGRAPRSPLAPGGQPLPRGPLWALRSPSGCAGTSLPRRCPELSRSLRSSLGVRLSPPSPVRGFVSGGGAARSARG